jgi:glycosyltransferase involved in cell wall biosynthesis
MATVHVIVPCYRYGHFLRACVESVLSQSWPHVTVTIVNDASPDDTASVADALASEDPRVSVVHHARNIGHIASYNESLAQVRADYSIILSADDLLTPGAVERAVLAFERYPDAALCFGDDVLFDTEGGLPSCRSSSDDVPISYQSYQSFLEESCRLGHTPIQAPTAFMRNSVQQAVGGFLPELPHSGDTEIWLRLAARGGVVRVGRDQAYRRLHRTNMSLQFSVLARLQEQERAFDAHFSWIGHHSPQIDRSVQLFKRELAQAALATASRAFDEGKARLADDAAAYARRLSADIRHSAAYRRFRLKRTAGTAVWSVVQPWLDRSRTYRSKPRVPQES